MRKTVFAVLFLLMVSLVSCNKKATLYSEKNIPVLKEEHATACDLLTQYFSDYSCDKFSNKTFSVSEKDEKLDITLLSDHLQVVYKTNAGNGTLFEKLKDIEQALLK